MSSLSNLREKAEIEGIKKLAVLEHLSQQIADMMTDLQGQKCRVNVDLNAGFVLISHI